MRGHLGRAIEQIAELVMKADCRNGPRISITFSSPADKHRFLAEVYREAHPLDPLFSLPDAFDSRFGMHVSRRSDSTQEGPTIYGLEVRVL